MDWKHVNPDEPPTLCGALAKKLCRGGVDEQEGFLEEQPPERQRPRLKRRKSILSMLAEGNGMESSPATAVTQLQQVLERPAPSGHMSSIPTLTPEEITLIQVSWAQVVEAHGIGAVTLFYVNLFTLGPHLEGLFKRTKGLQEVMFKDMMVLLVSKLHDWEYIVHALEASAVRHLRYGVTVSMFPTVGQALLQTLEMGLGPLWTPEVKAAWIKLWTAIVAVMSVHLRADALVRAVACNSLALVQAELERTPRGERIERMLTKMPSGLTPLLMAIRDKKFNIVKFMLTDILTIRSDRGGYYYGRAQLFATHPFIVGEIVENVPAAITVLLDGCCWQSGHSSEGLRRTNFYIEGFYGQPEKPIKSTPLAQMLNLRDNTAFQHPVTGMVIFQKWNLFGRKMFFRSVLIGLAAFLCLIMGYVTLPRNNNGLPFRALFWVYIVWDLGSEVRRAVAVGVIRIKILGVSIPILVHYFAVFQFVKLVMNLLVVAAIPFERAWNKDGRVVESVLMAIATIAYAFQMLQYYLASRELSSFVFTLSRMLYDLLKFMAVFMLIWIGFALAFFILLGPLPPQEGATAIFTSVDSSFLTFFTMLFGYSEFDFRAIESSRIQGVAIILWFLYLMLANMLLLNLLIAQFATTYKAVYKDSYAVSLRKLCQELLAIEGTLSTAQRRDHYEKMNFDEPLEFDEFDKGPSGGVQVVQDVDPNAGDVTDRIKRYGGKPSPDFPWPSDVPSASNLSPTPSDLSSPPASNPNEQREKSVPVRTVTEEDAVEENIVTGADNGVGNGDAGSDGVSPILHWDNKGGRAARIAYARSAEAHTLDGVEGFYRAGILRARAEARAAVAAPKNARGSYSFVTAAELAKHTTSASKWLALHGRVYDVTSFAKDHPGGPIINSSLGRDATKEFEEFGHSDYARRLLKPMKVGRLMVPQPSGKSLSRNKSMIETIRRSDGNTF